MKARTFIFFFFFLLFLESCKNETRETQIIDGAESLMVTYPDSAYNLLETILLPENLSDPLLARWCMLYGKAADTLRRKMPYVHQLTAALEYYEQKNRPFEQAEIGFYLGRSYVEDKELEKAAETYLDALDVALQTKNYNQAGSISSYMGDLYDFQDMDTLALEKYKKAAGYFCRAGNYRSQVFAMRDVARTYVFADSCEAALAVLREAEEIASALKDPIVLGDLYNALGNVYSSLGQTALAENYLLASLQTDSTDNAPNYLALAEVYRKTKDFERARLYTEKASALSSMNTDVPFTVMYTSYLIEKESNNLKEALAYLERYQIVLDSITAIRNKANIIEAEKKYDHFKVLSENMKLEVKVQRTFIFLILLCAASLVIILIYQILIKKKKFEIYEQQKALNEKDIRLLNLSLKLEKNKTELENLSQALEEKSMQVNMHISMEQQQAIYLQTKKEWQMLTEEIMQLRREKLLASSIAKKILKLSTKVIPGASRSPLSEKDWILIEKTVNEIYTSFSSKLFQITPPLSPSEIRYCYLVFFELDTTAESILLHITPESVSKYRQRIRNKVRITGENKDLYTYFVNL